MSVVGYNRKKKGGSCRQEETEKKSVSVQTDVLRDPGKFRNLTSENGICSNFMSVERATL